jgi:hypothetical protein
MTEQELRKIEANITRLIWKNGGKDFHTNYPDLSQLHSAIRSIMWSLDPQ